MDHGEIASLQSPTPVVNPTKRSSSNPGQPARMSESSGCPKRPVLIDIESGFSLSAGRFMTTKGNVVRANGSRLRALFNPTSLRLRQDQEKAERAAEVLSNKVFVAGQLKHYGIKFPRTAKLGFIRDILRRAVEQGKCDQVPPFVRRVEEVLRHDIRLRFATAGKRAQHDINRFLDLYFFTNGNPDPTKTPAHLALYGYRDIHTIYVEAGRVPGLSLISGGSGKNQVLCVGWDSFAVRKLAETIGETNRKDEDHQRDNDREHDTDYQLCGPAPDQNLANASQPLDLEWLFGSYVIQFEGITEDWHMTDVFTLDIGELNDGVLMAAYDFGDVWGTMILSQSEEKLDLWAMLNDNPRQTIAKARQRLPKRYGITPSASRRLFYKIRGRERGEDVIFYFPQRGHIDILDDECTKLSGMAERLAHMGSNLQFWGHKVADEPNKHIQGWGEFSEKQYEFERRDRWRRR